MRNLLLFLLHRVNALLACISVLVACTLLWWIVVVPIGLGVRNLLLFLLHRVNALLACISMLAACTLLWWIVVVPVVRLSNEEIYRRSNGILWFLMA